MPTSLVTGVTLGQTDAYGDGASVANKAQDAAPPGWDSFTSGAGLVSFDVSGRSVALDLTGAYASPAGSAVSLPLSGAPLVLGRIGDELRLGTPAIENAAFAAYPPGWQDGAFGGRTIVSPSLSGREVTLDLSGAYTPPTGANVGLYFGGAAVAAGITVGDSSGIGAPSLDISFSLHPGSIPAPQAGVALVSFDVNGLRVSLDLAGEYLAPAGSAASLPLSGAPLILGRIGAQDGYGTPSIESTADALASNGFDGLSFGNRTFIAPDSSGREVILDLSGNYTAPSAAAIQMAWGGSDKALDPQGFDTSAFGSASAFNLRQILGLAGIPAPTQGSSHGVANNARVLGSFGFDQARYGQLSAHNKNHHIGFKGWASEAFGQPLVRLGQRFLTPFPFAMDRYGYGAIRNRNYFIAPLGHSFTEYGQARVWDGIRWLTPAGNEQAGYGTARVEHAIRALYASGTLQEGYGAPAIGNRNRTIAPAGIWRDFASNHRVGGDRTRSPGPFPPPLAHAEREIPQILAWTASDRAGQRAALLRGPRLSFAR